MEAARAPYVCAVRIGRRSPTASKLEPLFPHHLIRCGRSRYKGADLKNSKSSWLPEQISNKISDINGLIPAPSRFSAIERKRLFSAAPAPIAALFVARAGTYANLGGVEVWDEFDPDERDDEGFDPIDECGRTRDGDCMLAGSEFCDFECPFRDVLLSIARSAGSAPSPTRSTGGRE